MRAVLQRVTEASVTVDGEVVGAIEEPGLLVLLGVTHDDTEETAERMAAKTWTLRILRDELACSDLNAPLLVVSQFTLYADTRKGRRPSWSAAAPGALSEPLYDAFCLALESWAPGWSAAGSAPRWRWLWSTTARSPSSSTAEPLLLATTRPRRQTTGTPRAGARGSRGGMACAG